MPPPVPILTTVTFDTPPPPGAPNSLLGVYQGIDFGSRWRWQQGSTTGGGPLTAPLLTNGIRFDAVTASPDSRTFTFSPGPRLLVSLVVVGWSTGSVTVSDDMGQTASLGVTAGNLGTLLTGWTKPSTTVTVTIAGWNLGVDDLVYQQP